MITHIELSSLLDEHPEYDVHLKRNKSYVFRFLVSLLGLLSIVFVGSVPYVLVLFGISAFNDDVWNYWSVHLPFVVFFSSIYLALLVGNAQSNPQENNHPLIIKFKDTAYWDLWYKVSFGSILVATNVFLWALLVPFIMGVVFVVGNLMIAENPYITSTDQLREMFGVYVICMRIYIGLWVLMIIAGTSS